MFAVMTFNLFLALTASIFSLAFEDGTVSGVEGNAAFFDGINSRIVIPADEVLSPASSFTLDVWICPVAFPKSPCPIFCRQDGVRPGGFNLWLDAHGKVHFSVACAGEWASAVTPEGVKLRRWSRVTCLFRSGNSFRIAVNGREVASEPMEMPYVDMKDYPLWIGRTQYRTPSFYENRSIPIYSSFDGAVDELKIIEGKETYFRILEDGFVEPEAPEFEQRRLPSGPEEPLAFGAWNIPLKYYKAWDEQWRGSLPDVVVGFGEKLPFRVVFWKGISYAPCFVTEKGNWMCNEFLERKKVTGWGCTESMSDKHADFSSIRILESTPARTVVVWRNAPVGVNQKFPFQSEETQWGDWTEETYIFYPDGVGVRKMDAWSSNLDEWYEWCQSLQVLHPDQCPEDVLDSTRIMSVAAMDGRSEVFGWDFESKAINYAPSIPGANIQVSYLKSRWNPFLVLYDGDGTNEKGNNGPEIQRYVGKWSEYSAFPWRNHWPVAQDYVIGRYAVVADAPSHTYTATQYNAPYSLEDGKMTKLMLCGCTDADAVDLLPLAKSWLRAPSALIGGTPLRYDLTQRAYVTDGGSIGSTLEFRADSSHPLKGLCVIVEDSPKSAISQVKVDGKAFRNWKCGAVSSFDSTRLVLWLDIDATKTVRIQFK